MKKSSQVTKAASSEIDRFLDKVDQHPVRSDQVAPHALGRLIFALDATASRQPTWDSACQLQAQMFSCSRAIGQLQIKLCFYRGYDELRSSRWHNGAESLIRAMTAVSCLGGHTQIGRLLTHALQLHRQEPIQALVFIGDCLEEPLDDLCQLAGECGLLGLPLFLFQEGNDGTASNGFTQMARLSGGAHCQFDLNSPERLQQLLNAVALYATGGTSALQRLDSSHSPALQQLRHQLTHNPHPQNHSKSRSKDRTQP